jgi:hypothetical protein
MSGTEKPHVIPEITICDGCEKAEMLRRINADNDFFSESIQEATDFAEVQEGFRQQAVDAGDAGRAALHEGLRDQHISLVADQASNVQGEVGKVNRLNNINCETVLGGQPACARYLGYAAEKGGVNLGILRREAEESGES